MTISFGYLRILNTKLSKNKFQLQLLFLRNSKALSRLELVLSWIKW